MSRPRHRTRWWLWAQLYSIFFTAIDELREPRPTMVYLGLGFLYFYIILIFSALGILDWTN